MNAYELAEKLDLEPYGIYGEQAANMIRQQANHISTLENQLDKYSHYEAMTHQEYMKQITELERVNIRAYDNGYEDGQKSLTTNAKPVAWMDTNGVPSAVKSELYSTPLYTTPQIKELSDEEILKMAADKFHYSEYRLVIEFAREVLKKASEK